MHWSLNGRRGISLPKLLGMLAILAVMIGVSLPGIARQRHADAVEECIYNLTRIENAKIKYALSHNLKPGATVTLQELVKACPGQLPQMPACPEGGKYEAINVIGTTPTCSLAAQGHWIHRLSRTRPGNGSETQN